jgi:hypothetical protein
MTKFAVWAVALTAMLASALGIFAPGAVAQEFNNPNVVLFDDVGYLPTQNPKLQVVRERLMKRRLLEEFRDFISPLRLPKTLRLVAGECPIGPHYLGAQRYIAWCYEFSPELEEDIDSLMKKPVPKGVTYTRQEVLAGAVAGIMLHELGHALFDILDVPVFGREEDGADQLSAFIAVQFSPDVARTVIKGFALWWLSTGDPSVEKRGPEVYSGEHGTGSQRMFNVLCMAYGANAKLFQDFVDSGWLPKARAVNCAEEFQQVRLAFQTTILPFIDEAQMKRVRARKWFQPGETEQPRK